MKLNKGLWVIIRLKTISCKHMYVDLLTIRWHSWAHSNTLHTYTNKAKAVSVCGSVTSTRDDRCQFSSHHHMTLCTCRGWMEIYGWKEGERDFVLWLKLATIPLPRFCKDMQCTCKHVCTVKEHGRAHTQADTHLHILYPPLFHLLTCSFHILTK